MMTKMEALERCRDHWQWIADNGVELALSGTNASDIKKEYFFVKGVPREDIPESSCYCCQYDDQIGRGVCGNCPLSGLAWDTTTMGCCEEGSLYKQWLGAMVDREHHVATKCALEIVDACEQALSDLKEGRKT